ncbi:MAG TPA: hypothetical protein DDZ89_14365 [Clostridiales bacterium]|nr:hypothetical protein [Clostridiales bacterium]
MIYVRISGNTQQYHMELNMIEIRESTLNEIRVFEKWQSDKSVARWIHIDDWENYYNIFRDNPNYLILSAFKDHKLVGEVSIQIEAKEAYISLIIAPDLQGQGIGTKVLKEICTKTLIKYPIDSIVAVISPLNKASIRCFEKAGFAFSHEDEDGEKMYKYDIERK